MRYHWIITWQAGPGRYRTQDGTLSFSPGTTRAQVFRQLFDQTAGKDDACVLFFSLEPDDLAGG